jgi:hypothetical protein
LLARKLTNIFLQPLKPVTKIFFFLIKLLVKDEENSKINKEEKQEKKPHLSVLPPSLADIDGFKSAEAGSPARKNSRR